MDKKEEFKLFVKKYPSFASYVQGKNTSWQELYELWDMYGDDDNVFSKYKIDKYIKNHNLPMIKYGKDRLFVKSEIEEWLDNRSKEIYGSRD